MTRKTSIALGLGDDFEVIHDEPKTWTLYDACACVEGFSGREHTEEETIEAWQWLIEHGYCFGQNGQPALQGWYGRTAADLIESGICTRPTGKDTQ